MDKSMRLRIRKMVRDEVMRLKDDFRQLKNKSDLMSHVKYDLNSLKKELAPSIKALKSLRIKIKSYEDKIKNTGMSLDSSVSSNMKKIKKEEIDMIDSLKYLKSLIKKTELFLNKVKNTNEEDQEKINELKNKFINFNPEASWQAGVGTHIPTEVKFLNNYFYKIDKTLNQ